MKRDYVNENYFGSYEYNSKVQSVMPSTRFNVASVRKSYIGFAISLALYQNKLSSIDDYISDYLEDLNPAAVQGVRIRHLLTPREVIERATTNQSPANLEDTLPRNGFAWWIQDKPRAISEIGNTVPSRSYQMLGLTGCACLVIPEHRIVAVRMYNQVGPNPPGYDYLEDIKAFGDKVLSCTTL